LILDFEVDIRGSWALSGPNERCDLAVFSLDRGQFLLDLFEVWNLPFLKGGQVFQDSAL
jgi:hypothetical protein